MRAFSCGGLSPARLFALPYIGRKIGIRVRPVQQPNRGEHHDRKAASAMSAKAQRFIHPGLSLTDNGGNARKQSEASKTRKIRRRQIKSTAGAYLSAAFGFFLRHRITGNEPPRHCG